MTQIHPIGVKRWLGREWSAGVNKEVSTLLVVLKTISTEFAETTTFISKSSWMLRYHAPKGLCKEGDERIEEKGFNTHIYQVAQPLGYNSVFYLYIHT